MVIVTRIFDPLMGALINIAALLHSIVSMERMKELESTAFQTGGDSFAPSGYDIHLKDVNFAYDNGEQVLNNLSFVAKQGEVTALVGSSGG